MKSQLIYCSACDREVQVVSTDAPKYDGQAPLLDADVVCLDIGRECTGSMCPICAQPPTEMARRLVRSGLQGYPHPTVHAQCDGCGRITDLLVLRGNYVTCTECGATSRWTVLKE